MSPLGRFALGAALGAVLCLTAVTAHAIELGEIAPEVEVNDVFNCDGFSVKEQRGRLILLELFSTG